MYRRRGPSEAHHRGAAEAPYHGERTLGHATLNARDPPRDVSGCTARSSGARPSQAAAYWRRPQQEMLMRQCLTVLAIAWTVGCAQVPPDRKAVDDAAAALGGKDRLLAAKTLTIEGGGGEGRPGTR